MKNELSYYKTAIETIYEISMEFYSSEDRKSALRQVLSILSDNLGMERGFILLYDENAKQLYIEASLENTLDKGGRVYYRLEEGIVGKVFRLGMPILIPDISKEPIFLNRMRRELQNQAFSFLAVPIKEDHTTFGVLAVDKNAADIFSTTTEIDLLKMISTLLASFLRKTGEIEEEKKILSDEKERLQNQVRRKFSFKGLIGTGKTMQTVFERVAMVSRTKSTVLIRGESGTGKEVVAKTVHYNSERADKPFIAVNCAAIPGELIESELFGYQKGAFTGATQEKKGKFEMADGGTLFLDEIGDMPHEAQSKLLRVLQEMRVERLGGTRSIEVNVRVITATNKNLEEEVRASRFRLDLYYRLNVVTIFLPPLRKRKEDIPLLAENKLKRFNDEYATELRFAPETLNAMMHCNYPGNVRELENCVERAALSAIGSKEIRPQHVSCLRGDVCYSRLMESMFSDAPAQSAETPAPRPPDADPPRIQEAYSPPPPMEERSLSSEPIPDIKEPMSERQSIIDALEKSGWVQAKAARMLGMTVRQMNYRIKKYDIHVRRF
ncbi:nif-specific transcriptional activator NifA [Limisalsivibrio acetivorans]|uniref:nif-specific transcriptional activator NifA n=1 Tax=Limisalsivibrio acetivorans TaxID=1304888 RepID=UPI00047D383F|nr:nif-specific transcriptional activator NifA [Limisalsivibrio acetivorans]